MPGTQRSSSPSISRFQIGLCALIAVDDLAGAGERLLAVRGRRRDDHRGLAERDAPDAVLGGRRLETVALDALGDDRGHPLLRHLAVGLVVEELDVADRALEGHDRAGPRPADEVGDAPGDERLIGDANVRRGRERAAADRREQRQLVAGAQPRVVARDLAVDRDAAREAARAARRAAAAAPARAALPRRSHRPAARRRGTRRRRARAAGRTGGCERPLRSAYPPAAASSAAVLMLTQQPRADRRSARSSSSSTTRAPRRATSSRIGGSRASSRSSTPEQRDGVAAEQRLHAPAGAHDRERLRRARRASARSAPVTNGMSVGQTTAPGAPIAAQARDDPAQRVPRRRPARSRSRQSSGGSARVGLGDDDRLQPARPHGVDDVLDQRPSRPAARSPSARRGGARAPPARTIPIPISLSSRYDERAQLVDGHGRAIGDVRISVTDRCGFRCRYCMPAEGMQWLAARGAPELRGDRARRARARRDGRPRRAPDRRRAARAARAAAPGRDARGDPGAPRARADHQRLPARARRRGARARPASTASTSRSTRCSASASAR